jgi:hypothetical protein
MSFFSVQHLLHLSYHLCLGIACFSQLTGEGGKDPNKTTENKLWASFYIFLYVCTYYSYPFVIYSTLVCIYKILQHIWQHMAQETEQLLIS